MKIAKWYYIRREEGGSHKSAEEESKRTAKGKSKLQKDFKAIDPELLEIAHGSAWSIESMAAHGAGGRSVEYIGSSIKGFLNNDKRKGKYIYDYYRDTAGAYWFKNRALLSSGEIVSMDMYIFGREIKKEKYTIQYRKNR